MSTGERMSDATAQRLTNEARVACRYLVHADCPPELVTRYIDAHRTAVPDVTDAVTRFAFDHPGAMPFLDAASALMRGGEGLRGKLYVMAAILEASPVFTKQFLPVHETGVATVFSLAGHGLLAGVKAAIGAPLLRALARATR